MLRGSWFADRLQSTGEIHRDRSILVVGAGATGATAAIRAAQHGAKVLLIEQTGGAFGLQARSSTRWIDPTQYDWPSEHWHRAVYPWRPPPVPLPFKANFSDRLAHDWRLLLQQHIVSLPSLNYQANFKIAGIHTSSGNPPFGVTLQTPSGTHFMGFDMIIWATGHGNEKNHIPSTTGGTIQSPPFWSTDLLSRPRCGLSHGIRPDVLIIGSGDGALQDFLRVATRFDSAKEIHDALPIPNTLRQAALNIESEFHRGIVWCEKDDTERKLYSARHESYRMLVEDLWQDPHFVSTALATLRKDIGSLIMALSSAWFTGYYGLNCFLALIIARAWEEAHSLHPDSILPHGLYALDGALTSPAPTYDIRFNLPGTVPLTITHTCHVPVIRIGIDSTSARIPLTGSRFSPPVRTRHLFPAHLPPP